MSAESTETLPATLSWYRDAANWVVGLSTGGIAGALAYHKDLASASRTALAIFTASTIALFLAVLAGIQFYFWITSYANQLERRNRLNSTILGWPHPTDPDTEKAVEDASSKMKKAESRFGYFYSALLWCFHIGAVGLGTVAVYAIAIPKPTPAEWTLVTVPCCPTARCRLPQPHVLRIEKGSGTTWYLTSDSLAPAKWVPIE